MFRDEMSAERQPPLGGCLRMRYAMAGARDGPAGSGSVWVPPAVTASDGHDIARPGKGLLGAAGGR
jgi:hypothetical protein